MNEDDGGPDSERRKEAPCPSGPPVDHYQPTGRRYTKKELTDRLMYAEAKAWSLVRKRQMCPLPLPEATERRIRQWFELVDGSGSGQLNAADLEFALKAAGIPADPNAVAEMIKMFDFDRDGEIAWREFHDVLSYEVMADKDPLGSDYVLPSGMSLPLGSMIDAIRRRKILEDVQKGGVNRDFWAAEGPDFLRYLLQSESYNFDEERREVLLRILSYKPNKSAELLVPCEAAEEHRHRIERLKLSLLRSAGGSGGNALRQGGGGRPRATRQQHHSQHDAAVSGISPWASQEVAAAALTSATSSSRRSLDAVIARNSSNTGNGSNRLSRIMRARDALRRETTDGGLTSSLWSTSSLWAGGSGAAGGGSGDGGVAAGAAAAEKGAAGAARGPVRFSGRGDDAITEDQAGGAEGAPPSPVSKRDSSISISISSSPREPDSHGRGPGAASASAGVWSATATAPRTQPSAQKPLTPPSDRHAHETAGLAGGAAPEPETARAAGAPSHQAPSLQAALAPGGGSGKADGRGNDPWVASATLRPAQSHLAAFGSGPMPSAFRGDPTPFAVASSGGAAPSPGASAMSSATAAGAGGDEFDVVEAASGGGIREMRQSWDAEVSFDLGESTEPAAPPAPPAGEAPQSPPIHAVQTAPPLLRLVQRSVSSGRIRPYSNSLIRAARGGSRLGAHATAAGPHGGGGRAAGGGAASTASRDGSYAGLEDRVSYDTSSRSATAAICTGLSVVSAPAGGGGSSTAAGGGLLSLQQFAAVLLQRSDAAGAGAHHPLPPSAAAAAARPLISNGRAEAAAAAEKIRRSVWEAPTAAQQQQQPRIVWPTSSPSSGASSRMTSYGGQGAALAPASAGPWPGTSADVGGLLSIGHHSSTHTGEGAAPDPVLTQQLAGPFTQGSSSSSSAALRPTVASPAPFAAAGQARPLAPTPSAPAQTLWNDPTWTAAAAQLQRGLSSLPITPTGRPVTAAAAAAAAGDGAGGRNPPTAGRRSFEADPRPGGAWRAAAPRTANGFVHSGKRPSAQCQQPGARAQPIVPGSPLLTSVGPSPPASPRFGQQLQRNVAAAPLASPPWSPPQAEAARLAGGMSAAGDCPPLSCQQQQQQQGQQHQRPGGGDGGSRRDVDGASGEGAAGLGFGADVVLLQPYTAPGSSRPSTAAGETASAKGGVFIAAAAGAGRKQDGAGKAAGGFGGAATAGMQWPWPWKKDLAAAGGVPREGSTAQPQVSRFRSSFLHWP